eukprot:7113014-Prymnesium_polylepis.1
MSYGCDCGGEILFDSDKRNEPKHLPQKRLEHERTVAHKDGLKKVRDPCSYSLKTRSHPPLFVCAPQVAAAEDSPAPAPAPPPAPAPFSRSGGAPVEPSSQSSVDSDARAKPVPSKSVPRKRREAGDSMLRIPPTALVSLCDINESASRPLPVRCSEWPAG